jgi:hypothetical protein
MWGALSDGRTGLSFKIAAGPRQRSQSRIRISSQSRSYVISSKEYINIQFVTDRKQYVSAAKSNRLTQLRKESLLSCENRTKHTDVLCGQNAEF